MHFTNGSLKYFTIKKHHVTANNKRFLVHDCRTKIRTILSRLNENKASEAKTIGRKNHGDFGTKAWKWNLT